MKTEPDQPFAGSSDPTLGVEVELQLIDAGSLRLTNAAPRVLAHFPGSLRVKPELLQTVIELNTEVCRDIAQVREDLGGRLTELQVVCQRQGVALAGTGVHGLSDWREASVTDNARYRQMVDRVQWLGRRFAIYGLHVHVGVTDGEKAIAICRSLFPYLPMLLGLTASSPFWQSQDTGLASARTKVFEAVPMAGLPPQLASWQEFCGLVSALINARAIATFREIWWDVRPHPDFGTIEIRVCDGVNTLSEILAVTALIQALVVWLGDRFDAAEELPKLERWTLKENKWRACRWGVDARLIVDQQGLQQPLVEKVEEVLSDLAPVAARLGSRAELEGVRSLLERPSYRRQRDLFEETGSLEAVVDANIRELRDDRPMHPAEPAAR